MVFTAPLFFQTLQKCLPAQLLCYFRLLLSIVFATHPHQLHTHPPTPRLIPYTFTLLHPPSHPHTVATGAQANYAGTDMCGTLQNGQCLRQTSFLHQCHAQAMRASRHFAGCHFDFWGSCKGNAPRIKKLALTNRCERFQE